MKKIFVICFLIAFLGCGIFMSCGIKEDPHSTSNPPANKVPPTAPRIDASPGASPSVSPGKDIPHASPSESRR